MIESLLSVVGQRGVDALAFLLAFALTALMDSVFHDKLPHDHGREFAVNGALSKGKARGSGLIFVLCIALVSLAFLPFKVEYVIYTILLIASMLSGYFDDAAETAWNEYKKGIIDFAIAIVAGADERCVDKAMKLIKTEYEVLEPLLDFTKAKDNEILVHPEDNWEALCPVGADNKRNLCAHDESSNGDIDKVLDECDIVIDRTYHTKACQQSMMETFRTFCTIDTYGRLHVVSSTQIVFHLSLIHI